MKPTKQTSLNADGFNRYAKRTRREVFLAEMDRVVLWVALCAVIEPVYPKAGPRGGRPWAWSACCACTSSPTGSTSATPRSTATRAFVGIDFAR